jgi:hypothetical protein
MYKYTSELRADELGNDPVAIGDNPAFNLNRVFFQFPIT